ncbi:MAG: hypothetical protein MUE60_01470, partial [Candidatus Eisenbacteria bacterium]|nr:hypothetical protein [Candidatus Eisenbacteria bacterium]
YAGVLKAKGCAVSFAPPDRLSDSVLAVASQPPVKAQIESLYCHEVVRDVGEVRVYRILGRATGRE